MFIKKGLKIMEKRNYVKEETNCIHVTKNFQLKKVWCSFSDYSHLPHMPLHRKMTTSDIRIALAYSILEVIEHTIEDFFLEDTQIISSFCYYSYRDTEIPFLSKSFNKEYFLFYFYIWKFKKEKWISVQENIYLETDETDKNALKNIPENTSELQKINQFFKRRKQ